MYPSPASAEKSDEDTRRPRRRIARACDSCFKRKIKCDGAQPKCNWCSHHDLACTFERVTVRKRKITKDARGTASLRESSDLAERIERIEKFLTGKLMEEPPAVDQTQAHDDLRPTPSAPELPEIPLTSHYQSSGSSSVALHFAGRELGVFNLFTGIPLLLPEGRQWVQSRTGQNVSFSRLVSSARTPWERQRAFNHDAMMMHSKPGNTFELPERRIVEAYFNMFCSSLMRAIFPVLDPVLYRETIREAYEQSQARPLCASASIRASIFAFVAFANLIPPPHYEQAHRGLAQVDGEAYIVKAQHFVPQILQETSSLEGLQVIAMLAMYELVTGNLQSANYYGSLAARMIFVLGGHTAFCYSPEYLASLPDETSVRTQQQIRSIFWLCYTLEKDVSLRTGQPQTFSDENCDLTLPPNYADTLFAHGMDSLDGCHAMHNAHSDPLYPVDIRLSIIKSRAYSALYSFRALKKTDAELLKEIRELDDDLERWRLSIPHHWRPTLSFSQETPDPNANMHKVMLRLNYHLCMTIIHQASSRCQSWTKDQYKIMDGVNSSLALSVEASRSTLLYLQASEHVLVTGIFWTLIFYPMSALLAIFCNILQNPTDPQATKDLGLLKTAMSMMERIFLRQPSSVNEIVHIKMVADFVTELYRLASCAIEKAWSERSAS
ncbi:putative C6 transcription factor [Aspergillus homomorphus CBS 101889]|uniref:C6 transcription factor n=1 Tax=Aspergillus homomorphus (strain CBS 101889) TaxID=1450537 RepID=A0A395HZC6_ASPHC|nr:C6 transcription factor [Aspergillus homomorphus CBS 101889]RAL13271.1 C6 transcription factor [Aspergillus homomorphus CBS 101889]